MQLGRGGRRLTPRRTKLKVRSQANTNTFALAPAAVRAVQQPRGSSSPLPPLSFLYYFFILPIPLFLPLLPYGPLSRHPASSALSSKVFTPLPLQHLVPTPDPHRLHIVNLWNFHLRRMSAATPYHS